MNSDSKDLSSEELAQIEQIREYWNKNPYEYQVSKSPPGTIDYFLDVESHHDQMQSLPVWIYRILLFRCPEKIWNFIT